MKKVTIEYLTPAGNCKQMTGTLVKYCWDGDVIIINDKGARKKGMPVQFHE
jgi:hypothetical protein